jgi:hypothetical protein
MVDKIVNHIWLSSALQCHYHIQRALHSPRLHTTRDHGCLRLYRVLWSCTWMFVWTIHWTLITCEMYYLYHINIKTTFQLRFYNINLWILFAFFHKACSSFSLSFTCSNNISFSVCAVTNWMSYPYSKTDYSSDLVFWLILITREEIFLRQSISFIKITLDKLAVHVVITDMKHFFILSTL